MLSNCPYINKLGLMMIVEHYTKTDHRIHLKSTIHSRPVVIRMEEVDQLVCDLLTARSEYNKSAKSRSFTIKGKAASTQEKLSNG